MTNDQPPFKVGDKFMFAGAAYVVKLCERRVAHGIVAWCIDTDCGRRFFADNKMIRAKDDFELRTFDTKWPDTAIAVETMRQELAAIRERFCPGASLQEVLESID